MPVCWDTTQAKRFKLHTHRSQRFSALKLCLFLFNIFGLSVYVRVTVLFVLVECCTVTGWIKDSIFVHSVFARACETEEGWETKRQTDGDRDAERANVRAWLKLSTAREPYFVRETIHNRQIISDFCSCFPWTVSLHYALRRLLSKSMISKYAIS